MTEIVYVELCAEAFKMYWYLKMYGVKGAIEQLDKEEKEKLKGENK